MSRLRLFLTRLAIAAAVAGCAQPALLPADPVPVLLLGEQHDAPAHQRTHREVTETLAARGQLAALVLEMAQQGTATTGLPRDAEAAQVRQALHWNDDAWPWDAYGPAIMAAVRAGVPVLGANLAGTGLRAAMADTSLDTLLPGPAWQAQRQAVREGHCGLLPESRIDPMTRVQVARDRAMAQVLAQAAAPGRTVLLLAGHGHVDPAVGVPLHLPRGLRVQATRLPAAPTGRDYCEELRQQMGRPRSAAPT